MIKRITVILTIVLSASACLASGWNDYELDIGDGYNVFRANSMDVCIGKADNGLILTPQDYDHVGPVVRYITTPRYIFTKNLGRSSRNLFEGDTFEDIDSSREFFFVISKGSDEVAGPFSEDEFIKRPEVAGLAQLDWQIPRNPDFWLPLYGNLMFIAISIPILAIKFFWITIPVIIGLILLITLIRRRNKEKAQPEN